MPTEDELLKKLKSMNVTELDAAVGDTPEQAEKRFRQALASPGLEPQDSDAQSSTASPGAQQRSEAGVGSTSSDNKLDQIVQELRDLPANIANELRSG